MTQFKGIVFDMDGTLVDSEIIWEEAESEMFAARGLTYTDEARQQVIGLRMDAFFQKLIEIYDLDETVEALSADLIERMLAKIPTMVKAKPGAEAIIEWATEHKLPYCIASSSPNSIIDAIVIAQGWDDLIPKRYSADEVALGKPAPDVYLYAAEQIGINPAECLALEDSPNGSKAAVAAGMTTYIIPDGHSDSEQFADISPHIFDSLHDVLNHLKET